MQKVLGEENSAAEDGKKESGGKSGGEALILIVEDDKFLRDLISKKLVGEGFKIAAAVDGKEAGKGVFATDQHGSSRKTDLRCEFLPPVHCVH